MTVLVTSFGPVEGVASVAGAIAAAAPVEKIFTIGKAKAEACGGIKHLSGRPTDTTLVQTLLDEIESTPEGKEMMVVATDGVVDHDPLAYFNHILLSEILGAELVVVADGTDVDIYSDTQDLEDAIIRVVPNHVKVRSVVLIGGYGPVPKIGDVSVTRIPSPGMAEILNAAGASVFTADQLNAGPMSPERFEHFLISRGRESNAKIVLCEGSDDRILKAAHQVLERRVAELIILGDMASIMERAEDLDLDLSNAEIIDPKKSPLKAELTDALVEARKHKGMTVEKADKLTDQVTWFGTLLVHTGKADGMVSGAAHSTADTVRPALQIVKTKKGAKAVSSAFLMALHDRVQVYADCAITPNPTAEQLAEIALQSAQTAQAFGIEPRVAMLSYSTGSSGSGADVDRAVEATKLAKKQAPGLALDGPIQFDAAFDPKVGASKAPDSPVAGKATVFIFPDLESGNVTYKAVQRTANAVAIGPLLQGLAKPINDLSRGCTVTDIVNTVAMTAVQSRF